MMFRLFASFIALLFYITIIYVECIDDSLNDDPLLVLRRKSLTSPECGILWRDDFKLHHDSIRYDKEPLRFFIVAHDGQGANDRLTSMLTGFLAALVSKRAYFLMTYNGEISSIITANLCYSFYYGYMIIDVPDFQLAFDTPMINMTLNDTWKQVFTKRYPHDVNYNHTLKLYYRDKPPLFHPSHNNRSLLMIYGDFPIIWFNSNRGYAYHLIKDSMYGTKLREYYKINPYYGFSCIFHHLFRPNAELLALAKPYTTHFRDASTIKIGIQIRAGDHIMQDNTELHVNTSSYYENFFDCASYLEETRIKHEHNNKKVIWYLISDSLSLKRDAKLKYHDKVVANILDRPVHSGNGGVERGGSALRLLFSEQLTLSLCDYFIISEHSHVGRVAIWLSEYGGSRNNSYVVYEDRKRGSSKTDYCQHVEHDYLLADEGAGI